MFLIFTVTCSLSQFSISREGKIPKILKSKQQNVLEMCINPILMTAGFPSLLLAGVIVIYSSIFISFFRRQAATINLYQAYGLQRYQHTCY